MTKATKNKLHTYKYLGIIKDYDDPLIFKDEADLESYFIDSGGRPEDLRFFLIGSPITVEVGKIKITVNK